LGCALVGRRSFMSSRRPGIATASHRTAQPWRKDRFLSCQAGEKLTQSKNKKFDLCYSEVAEVAERLACQVTSEGVFALTKSDFVLIFRTSKPQLQHLGTTSKLITFFSAYQKFVSYLSGHLAQQIRRFSIQAPKIFLNRCEPTDWLVAPKPANTKW
jgi:hypothetical protein